MKKKEKYVIVCPTWKRMLYKTLGIVLILLTALSYLWIPNFWTNQEHLLLAIGGACVWLITKAGYKNEKD